MSEQLQDTFMSSVADNLAESFFEGGATSQNIITPATKDSEEGKTTPEKVDFSTNNIKSPAGNITADDIIGDLLKKPANVEEIIEDTAKEKKEVGEQRADNSIKDFDF